MEEPDSDATRDVAPAIARSTPPVVGDSFVDEPERYAIDGHIGAGGMGVVLAATAARLGRPVALKIITADRDDLRRRFEREAEVTAKLQHPSIVPVYGSGRREGQPFYAMKHVTGDPLDKVIAKTTSLNERIALLPKVIAVSEAIAYAHSEKVIHRDLKPANILVGAFGETVVIDWGLAKDMRAGAADEDSESASPYRGSGDETAHGKVMGTPAYMPLEQARGEPVDARADVYALGAILHHVLAGRAPYKREGEDSVAWESMLARVIAGEPEPLGDDVPLELRAIVVRAMARDAKDRYPTARELAEDLRRFQTGQLVGAHRYSTWQLVKRWLGRHRAAVIVAAIALAVLAVGGGLSIKRILDEEEKTEEQRAAAVASRGQAEDLMDFMLVDLRDKLRPLGKLPLLKAVADRAIAYYQGRTDNTSPDDDWRRVQALENAGDVLFRQGDMAGARKAFEAARAIVEPLASQVPPKLAWQLGVGIADDKLADVLVKQGDTSGALVRLRSAVASEERLVGEHPTARVAVSTALAHLHIAEILRDRSDTSGALVEATSALSIMRKVSDSSDRDVYATLSNIYNHLGELEVRAGSLARAHANQRDSIDAVDKALALDPADAELLDVAAVERIKLGDVLELEGKTSDSIREFRSGLEVCSRLLIRDPTNAVVLLRTVALRSRIGDALTESAPDDALVEYQASIATLNQLRQLDASNWEYVYAQSIVYHDLGSAWLAKHESGKALEAFTTSDDLIQRAVAHDPTNEDWRRGAMIPRELIGHVYMENKDFDKAAATFRDVVKLADDAVARHPDARNRNSLALTLDEYGEALQRTRAFDAAIVQHERGLAIREELFAKDPTNADTLRGMMTSKEFLAGAYADQHKLRDARRMSEDAVALANKLVSADPSDRARQADLGDAEDNLSLAWRQEGDNAKALEHRRAAATLFRALTALDSRNLNWQSSLANDDVLLADALASDPATVRLLLQEALTARSAVADADPTNATKAAAVTAIRQRLR